MFYNSASLKVCADFWYNLQRYNVKRSRIRKHRITGIGLWTTIWFSSIKFNSNMIYSNYCNKFLCSIYVTFNRIKKKIDIVCIVWLLIFASFIPRLFCNICLFPKYTTREKEEKQPRMFYGWLDKNTDKTEAPTPFI